jgi:hypothetical protein
MRCIGENPVKRIIWLIIILLLLEVSEPLFAAKQKSAGSLKPRLVVAIIADQFRYDYLLRYRSDYSAGLQRLLTKGAVFTNARYDHYPTYTSVGHAAFLTGAFPSVNGIVGNQWYDRDARKIVGSADDPSVAMAGSDAKTGYSPRNLLVSTLGDEIKIANAQAKVFGISLKHYAAILSTGHMADGAFWFDSRTGNFVGSTYTLRICQHGSKISTPNGFRTDTRELSGLAISFLRAQTQNCMDQF